MMIYYVKLKNYAKRGEMLNISAWWLGGRELTSKIRPGLYDCLKREQIKETEN